VTHTGHTTARLFITANDDTPSQAQTSLALQWRRRRLKTW